MLKNHCLAQAVSDSNFGEIRRQLEYKADWHGVHICHHRPLLSFMQDVFMSVGTSSLNLSLSERLFICEQCGMVLDRDLNAALNIRRVAGSSPDTLNACGEKSAGILHE